MNHDIAEEGVGFRLRPVGLDDAEFIVGLRTDPELGRYLHTTSPSIDDQKAWTERYFERSGDWYFIIEHKASGRSEGAIAIYDHDPSRHYAVWGRWIIRKGSLSAVESASLIYDIGFGRLGLQSMSTLADEINEPVVSFHRSFGLRWIGPVAGPDGEEWVEQNLAAEEWPAVRESHRRQVEIAAAMSNR